MKKIQVNTIYNFEVKESEGQILMNGDQVQIDMQRISEKRFHFLFENRSYSAEVVDVDYRLKEAIVKINGKEYKIVLKDENDTLLERLGIETNSVSRDSNLKAPMPGLVLDILVQPGDQLKKGDKLLILEAMKMENLIKSPADFTVKSVEIQKGDKVEKNQVLLNFD